MIWSKFYLFSKIFCLTSLGISDVDTIQAWGDKRPPPTIRKYLSENFPPSHINLTNNNPKKTVGSREF